MKTPLLLLGLLLLVLFVTPAGHSAHHRRHYPVGGHQPHTPQLLPLRVVRTPAVAQQHRHVQAVTEK